MSRAGLVRAEIRRRLDVAHTVAEAGGNLTACSERLALPVCTAAKFLKKHDPDLHRRLSEGPRGPYIGRHAALVRLLLLKSVEDFRGGQARLARALGMRPNTLALFKRNWAPDGLDAAIADLMPDDAEAA